MTNKTKKIKFYKSFLGFIFILFLPAAIGIIVFSSNLSELHETNLEIYLALSIYLYGHFFIYYLIRLPLIFQLSRVEVSAYKTVLINWKMSAINISLIYSILFIIVGVIGRYVDYGKLQLPLSLLETFISFLIVYGYVRLVIYMMKKKLGIKGDLDWN